MPVERNVEGEQIANATGRLAGEDFDGGLVTQAGARGDRVLVVQPRTVGR